MQKNPLLFYLSHHRYTDIRLSAGQKSCVIFLDIGQSKSQFKVGLLCGFALDQAASCQRIAHISSSYDIFSPLYSLVMFVGYLHGLYYLSQKKRHISCRYFREYELIFSNTFHDIACVLFHAYITPFVQRHSHVFEYVPIFDHSSRPQTLLS